MRSILFIKTSSLGDVIHNMPAITDARRHHPQARIAWLVEEEYAALAGLHPGVDEVLPVATRRWRRRPYAPAIWREICSFVRGLRRRRYDAVIDTQGLLRTAMLARLARGTRYGYDADSVRERAAAWLYDRRHAVARRLHAIERNRRLTAQALGYVIGGEPDYGLAQERPAAMPAYVVLLHASARDAKRWPERHWAALASALHGEGLEIVLPWGDESERRRSEAIAQDLAAARVPQWTPLDRLAELMAGARLVVGPDTGLLHLAAAVETPAIGVFVDSDPELTRPCGRGPIAVLGRKGEAPQIEEVVAAARRMLATQRA